MTDISAKYIETHKLVQPLIKLYQAYGVLSDNPSLLALTNDDAVMIFCTSAYDVNIGNLPLSDMLSQLLTSELKEKEAYLQKLTKAREPIEQYIDCKLRNLTINEFTKEHSVEQFFKMIETLLTITNNEHDISIVFTNPLTLALTINIINEEALNARLKIIIDMNDEIEVTALVNQLGTQYENFLNLKSSVVNYLVDYTQEIGVSPMAYQQLEFICDVNSFNRDKLPANITATIHGSYVNQQGQSKSFTIEANS